MRPVNIVQDRDPEERPVPALPASRSRYALAFEGLEDGVHSAALGANHTEDTPHDSHLVLINEQPVARLVEFETVLYAGTGHDLTLPGLLELASPTTLTYLRPLVLAELVQDAVRELALGTIVSPVVEGADLRPVLLKLPPQQVMVGGLAGEPVAVLCQHHGGATSSHEVPHTVHTWPLKAGAALSGILLPPQGPRSLHGQRTPAGLLSVGRGSSLSGLARLWRRGRRGWPALGRGRSLKA